jgi:hypothetical protein
MSDSTSYEQLSRAVCERVGWTYETLTTQQQWRPMRTAINGALRKEWQTAWHEDLMRVERLTLRPAWDAATAYTAATWVYFEDADDYFVALQASTNEAPATWDGAEWDTNLAYWAHRSEPSAVDQGEWTDGTDYTLGQRVSWHGDEYACIVAHTASSSILPSNTTYWGNVPVFDWEVPAYQDGRTVIGRGREAATLNPRLFAGAQRIAFEHTSTGVRLAESPVPRPWLEYRIRAPQLTGEVYDATAAYDEEDDNQAVYGK